MSKQGDYGQGGAAMTGRLDPTTLRALIAEAQAHYTEGIVRWLQAHLDALPKEPPSAEACWICGKPKGQPPERCPGHYAYPEEPEMVIHNPTLVDVAAMRARIPPDLAGPLREWRAFRSSELSHIKGLTYPVDEDLAAAIDAARKDGWL